MIADFVSVRGGGLLALGLDLLVELGLFGGRVLPDLLGVVQRVGDFLLALFHHAQQRLVREALQDKQYDQKINGLGDQPRQADA